MSISKFLDHGLRFVYGTSRGVLAAWAVATLLDIAVYLILGVNLLAALDVRNAWSTSAIFEQQSSPELMVLLALLTMVTGSFRRGLWLPAKNIIVDNQTLTTSQIVWKAFVKVFPAIVISQIIAMLFFFLSTLFLAFGLTVATFPLLFLYLALAPAYFIILTDHRGFMDGFGESLRWAYRYWKVLFSAQLVGIVLGMVASMLFQMIWGPSQSIFAWIGAASIYLAVSWLSWVFESAGFFAVLKEESR